MKKLYSTLLFVLISTISFSQTFDWETAYDSGNGIIQNVSGITATFTSSHSPTDSVLIFGGGYLGSTANLVFSYSVDQGLSTTVSFSSPINISSVYAIAPYQFSGTRTWTFTPSGGTNSIVNQDITSDAGVPVNLNWTNVSAFTITSSNGGDSFGLDDIVFTLPTLSTNNAQFNTITLYPNPTSNFIKISGLVKAENYNILDVRGAIIKKGVIEVNQQINIQNLANGLYFLKFENGNAIRFLKE